MAAGHQQLRRAFLARRLPRPRVFKDRLNPLEDLDEDEVFARYRFRPPTILFIVGLVAESIRKVTKRNCSLPPLYEVLCALRFFATGAFQIVIGDTLNVSQTTAGRCCRRVARALVERVGDVIRFPRGPDAISTKQLFYQVAGFPNVLGCIDGTFIRLMRPSEHEMYYVNRKGFHSLNVQNLQAFNFSLGELDLTSEDFLLEEVDANIQQNLEDDIVKEALKTGVDLRQYSKQVEQDLLEVENASIQDYIKESQPIASLHKQIAACDTILERMEQMLNGFQSDLSSISTEIQSLQEQSVAMNVKLKNRQSIRGELSQFVDEMVIPESMINHILDTPVTEREFLEQLHELNHKINFVKEQSFRDARSCADVKDILEKLKIKAIAKIREFLLQKISSFKKPMTNYQIPQNTMLKFRFFNEFLMANERHVAKEVRDEYLDTMSKIYYSYFKGYLTRLMKLQFVEVATKDDLMAVDDSIKKGFFSSKTPLKNRSTVFTLGNRGDVLTTDLEAPIIVPHAAQKSEIRYTFEQLFRSLHFALMDNACREYLFLTDFFMASGTAALDLFNTIMGKALSIFLKSMEDHASECYDSIAIFLSIHIIHRYRSIMETRCVPALERYWESVLQAMWPRFEHILHLNIHSVRDCDPNRLGHIDFRPHYITRRYAEFSAAIVGINQSYPNERVHRVLGALQAEVDSFVLKMAAEFPQRREQLIFLINNYDMMLGVITERTTEDSKESENFKELLTARTHEFVEEVLTPHFGGMIMFVKDCEGIIERGHTDALRHEERRIQQIVRGFSNDWKRALEVINHDVMRAFTNFKNGTQILQGSLTQLIQYYHRFQKVLNHGPFRNLPVRNELINIHHVMVEVKKYKPTF